MIRQELDVVGVHWNAPRRMWQVRPTINGSVIGAGSFKKHSDAAKALGALLGKKPVSRKIIQTVLGKIFTRKGQEFLIDEKWHPMLSEVKWHLSGSGYSTSVDHQTMHRIIMDAQKGQEVDHINGDKMDNREENLRLCTRAQNSYNQKARSNNKSGYKGVSWSLNTNKWLAQISIAGKQTYLGCFVDIKEAAQAYDSAAIKYHGNFAKTNEGKTS